MFVILLALWLIFAGSVTLTNLILGALVAGLITLLCTKFMGYDTRRFYRGLSKADEIAVYLAYLLKEIVRENFDVLRFIYRRGQPKPMLVRFNGGMQHEALRVLVANSITLTPGTYTVKLEGDEYAVHALDEYFQVDIEYSAFFKMARKVEEA
ncbi:MAG: Na+/H+ antiporter subunit E [Oscillospiraceae bacterium]|nr:Na+/H+ antiporter subunit E [Oscillospiraceae bacterium]